MRKTISRLRTFAVKYRNPSFFFLLPLVFASSSHALPSGSVGTIYNGPLPSDMQVGCVEAQTCSAKGIQEVWYGAGNSWIYKLVGGTISCNNETFTDPAPKTFKACYVRDLTVPEILPPNVNEIPLTFQLNDLLAIQNKRYSFGVWDGDIRKAITNNSFAINLKASSGPLRLQQKFFQFDITDEIPPIRQHSVFISPTFNRCLVSHLTSSGNVVSTYGRIVEIYAMTSMPSAHVIPQRSDTQKICTNDKGQLAFNLQPPSTDSFQIKIVDYDANGRQNDVFDFFLPIDFEWRKMQ